MPRTISLVPHLPLTDLEQRYRQCRDPVERSHWHMIWLVGQGHSGAAVARLTGYSETWVRTVIHRDNDRGPDGLLDRRRTNPGHPPLVPPPCGRSCGSAWPRYHRTEGSGPVPTLPPG